jgi:MFS family permease
MGLQKDANITGDQFSQLAMIFYVSYLACEFPHAYGMQTLPTAKYLAAMVTLWGVIVVCTSAAKNWAGLVTTRVLLGVFESAVAPSLMLITVSWYKVSCIRVLSTPDNKKITVSWRDALVDYRPLADEY